MSGLTGNVASLKDFSKRLRSLPTVVSHRVAEASASGLTTLLQQTFDAGEDSYGNTWKPLEDGKRATNVKTGALERGLVFVAIGRLLRVRVPVSYAKYALGRRPATPRQGAPLPTTWVRLLQQKTSGVCKSELAA